MFHHRLNNRLQTNSRPIVVEHKVEDAYKLTKIRNELIVSGFIGNNYNAYGCNIPKEIIMIIIEFYTTEIIWILPRAQFYDLTRKPRPTHDGYRFHNGITSWNYKVYGPPWIIQNIPFSISFANGEAGNSMLQIHATVRNLKISHAKVKIILQCFETNTEWRQTFTFSSQLHCSSCGWGNNLARGGMDYWNLLPFDECKKYEQLTFSADLEILSILNENIFKPQFIKQIKLNAFDEQIQFEWKVDETLFDTFKNCRTGEIFYSDTFGVDNNFCLMCYPKGNRTWGNQNVQVYIVLLKSTYMCDFVKIKYGIEVKSEMDNFYRKISAGCGSISYQYPMGNRASRHQFKIEELSSVTITATVIIQPRTYI
eukprot:337295_1